MNNRKRDEFDAYTKPYKFDPDSSIGLSETCPPQQYHSKGKSTFQSGQIKNQHSFKNQYETHNEIMKNQYNRPTLNHKLSQNQPRNLPNKGNSHHGKSTDAYSGRNQINDTSPISKEDKHSLLNTENVSDHNSLEQKEGYNKTKIIPSVAPQGGSKLRCSDGNKEEGELTDEDSETGVNKQNIDSFDDYAEPISSPE